MPCRLCRRVCEMRHKRQITCRLRARGGGVGLRALLDGNSPELPYFPAETIPVPDDEDLEWVRVCNLSAVRSRLALAAAAR